MSLSMSMWALLCNAADFIVVMESCERVLANNHSNYKVSFPLFVLFLVFNFSYSCYAYYYCYDFPSFCSNYGRKCLILPAQCSPQNLHILLEILPAEFIQAY